MPFKVSPKFVNLYETSFPKANELWKQHVLPHVASGDIDKMIEVSSEALFKRGHILGSVPLAHDQFVATLAATNQDPNTMAFLSSIWGGRFHSIYLDKSKMKDQIRQVSHELGHAWQAGEYNAIKPMKKPLELNLAYQNFFSSVESGIVRRMLAVQTLTEQAKQGPPITSQALKEALKPKGDEHNAMVAAFKSLQALGPKYVEQAKIRLENEVGTYGTSSMYHQAIGPWDEWHAINDEVQFMVHHEALKQFTALESKFPPPDVQPVAPQHPIVKLWDGLKLKANTLLNR